MKRIFLSLVAIMACMSINAQVVKVYENGALSKTFTNTATNTVKVVFEDAPDSCIGKGLFTVNASGMKVKFTTGNLRATYNGSSYDFSISAHQYDFIGDAAANNSLRSISSGQVVDLFGWSTSSTNFGINPSTDPDLYIGDFIDWSTIPAFSDKGYRTLTDGENGEWKYLLQTRTVNGGTGEGYSYQQTTLTLENGKTVYGLLIAPDDFTGTLSSYSATSWDDWKNILEPAGIVFLPGGGYRNGTIVCNVGKNGRYWSATSCNTVAAYGMYFWKGGAFPASSLVRFAGASVRLVREVK